MKVREICKSDVVTIRGFDELIVAANRMRERHVGYLVVVEPMAPGLEPPGRLGEKPIGVLTDRDLVVTVMAGGADPRLLKVEDVMTRRAVTAYDDESVGDALLKMRSIGVRRLPVISAKGALVGVLSVDDVLDSLASELRDVVGSIQKEQRVECALRP
jgi:CBS domain-containing protein